MKDKPKYIVCKSCGKEFRANYDFRNGLLKSKKCGACVYKDAYNKNTVRINRTVSNKTEQKKRNTKRLKTEEVFDKNGKLTPKAISHYKYTPTKTLQMDAIKYFNRFIKLRDTDDYGFGICISSGQYLRYIFGNGKGNNKNEVSQAGHFIARGDCKALEFNEDNVHLQGKSDNYFNHGNANGYRPALIEKIGETRVKELERVRSLCKKTGYKKSDFEKRYIYITVKHKYMIKCRELLKTKKY